MGRRTDSARRAQTAERRRRNIELRLAGATFEAIAVELGYSSRHEACVDLGRALRQRAAELHEVAGQMLEVELARLDRMQLALWPKVLAGDTRAATTVLRIMEQRSRLLGLDAPIKHEVVTVDVLDAEIARLEAEQRRRAHPQGG